MRFDSNLAWRDAMALVSANREVLLVIAGVFFFLPSLAAALFLGDNEAQMAQLGLMQNGTAVDPQQARALVAAMLARTMPVVLVMLLVQAVGHLAMIALLTDARRPTVGEALGIALRVVPTLVGVILLLIAMYLVLGLGVALVLGLAFAVLHSIALAVVAVIAVMAALLLAVVRLALLYPVMVIDGVRNPWQVIARAWALTRHNTGRLLGFFLLLGIAYVVIALLIQMITASLVGLALPAGEAAVLLRGIVGGAIGAVAGVVITAVLVAIHRQLAGPTAGLVTATFE